MLFFFAPFHISWAMQGFGKIFQISVQWGISLFGEAAVWNRGASMQTRVSSIGATGLPLCGSRSPACRSFVTLPKKQYSTQAAQSTRSVRVAAAQEAESDEGLTGEWPVNWSLASYEDVGEFFQKSLFKASASPGNSLQDIMNTDLTYTFPDVSVDNLGDLFAKVGRSTITPSMSRMQSDVDATVPRITLYSHHGCV